MTMINSMNWKQLLSHAYSSSDLVRFAIVGGVNTVFGYSVNILLYFTMKNYIDAYFISLCSGFLSVFFSLFMQSRFVFYSEKNSFKGFRRGFLVYGALILFSAGLYKFLIDFIQINVFTVQAIVLMQSWLLSYIFLKHFAFSNRTDQE